MRTKKLKEIHDVSIGLEAANEALIRRSLQRLKEEGLSEEARLAEVNLLEEELELRDTLKKGQNLYRERKAENRGFWTAITGSTLGIAISEFGPKVWQKLRKK